MTNGDEGRHSQASCIRLGIQRLKYLSHIRVPDVFRTQAKAPEANVATEMIGN